jgi:hypothetical protein
MLVSGHAASASLDLAQANLICEFPFLPQTISVLDSCVSYYSAFIFAQRMLCGFILHRGDILDSDVVPLHLLSFLLC